MRKLAATVLTLLMSAQPLTANWCNMSGDWVGGAHALVLVPVICEFDYAAVPTVTGDEPVSTLKCELDWGFRVFGRYLSRCSFTGVSYQWYASKVSQTTTAPQLFTRNGINAVTATASLRLRYQNADFRIGRFIHRSRGRAFYLFGNARWVDLQQNRRLRSGEADGDVVVATEQSRLQGGALGVGAGAEFNIYCDLSLFGEANILGVIADRSATARSVATLANGQVNVLPFLYRSDVCVNPEVNLRLGVDYAYTCGCWTFIGEVGYELDYFWNAVSFGQLDINATSVSLFRRCEDVGFSGLFFGLRVLF